MKKRLKICDWSLLVVSVLMLASGIQLEITSGRCCLFVWLHIIIGVIFAANILWHLQLHYHRSNWLSRLWKRPATIKWLTATGLLTLATGLWATGEWLATHMHGHVGAVHGKLGFLMFVVVIIHTVQKFRFYRR